MYAGHGAGDREFYFRLGKDRTIEAMFEGGLVVPLGHKERERKPVVIPKIVKRGRR